MEEQAREFRAFREAQRSMLDQLSIGVAQFDAERRLTFANQPFQRIFALPPSARLDPLDSTASSTWRATPGGLPEARDFPAWRRELGGWFTAGSPSEDQWTLSDGTHLRIVAQPMPDGGLSLVAEDRSEQLALSAVRDTLLRTRTATFDSLFESLAVFAPDGRMQLWNRRFPEIWGLPEECARRASADRAAARRIGAKARAPGAAPGDRRGRAARRRSTAGSAAGGSSWPTDARSSSPGFPLPGRQRTAHRARRDRQQEGRGRAARAQHSARGGRRGQDPLPRQHEATSSAPR
jgi:PAS domain-containing protein